MFTGTHAALMAEYNLWMNEKIYAAAAGLSDEERRKDRGAFFKSIHSTLNHILWADWAWLARFTGKDFPPGSIGQDVHARWEDLRAARTAMDAEILAFSRNATPAWLAEPMTWTSKLYGFTQTHPRWVQVTHMFNHQTHHRGQIHALLTSIGIDIGVTDLPMLPALNAPAA